MLCGRVAIGRPARISWSTSAGNGKEFISEREIRTLLKFHSKKMAAWHIRARRAMAYIAPSIGHLAVPRSPE